MARTYRLTSPYMHGDDIKRFQRDLNARARARGIDTVKVDGQYGKETRSLFTDVGFALGLPQKSLEKGATPYARSIIRHPGRRNPTQLKRAKARQKTIVKKGDAATAVVKWANSHVGDHETPGRPNRGPFVDKVQLDFGRWMLGQPWCGAFVGYGLRHVGGINVANDIVYTPNILTHARNGTGGFSKLVKYSDAKPGDVAVFKFPGISNDSADHTGLVVDVKPDGTVVTVEGNTSSGSGGSQNNGGGVYKRERPKAHFAGIARPRY